MGDKASYDKQVAGINERAALFMKAVVNPQLESRGSSKFITDSAERNAELKSVVQDTIFDNAGEDGPMLLATAANAVRNYHDQRGHMPTPEMMASCYKTMENMLTPGWNPILDSLTGESNGSMSNRDGVIHRNHQVALVTPTMLMSVTSDMVTHIPANYDQSEIFRINRRAGSDFGDLSKGDIIDVDFMGQYSSMDQRHTLGTGNGTDTQFVFNVNTVTGQEMPLRKELVRIYHDRNLVAEDNGKGHVSGTLLDSDADNVVVTGTVDYVKGIVTVNFSKAPKTGIELDVGVDISIERDPSLIPVIEHEMNSWVVRPHESAISMNASIQSVFSMKREFNLDLNSMQLGTARNFLAGEKDRKRLNDMYYFSLGEKTWEYTVPMGVKFSDHYESIRETFLQISQELMVRTKKSGLVGVVCGSKASALLQSIGVPHFIQAKSYRRIPQPHYVGKIFGYDMKEDPYADEWSIMCYAKGRDHGDAGYVAADAISAVNYAHSIQKDLRHSNTLYELAYRDLHPYDGRSYFTTLKLIPTPAP